jgi:hypothetical protein
MYVRILCFFISHHIKDELLLCLINTSISIFMKRVAMVAICSRVGDFEQTDLLFLSNAI